jgi:PAS domain S-box-containing protein
LKAFRRSVRTKIFAAVLLACLAPFLAAVLLQARASDANLRAAALDQASTAGALARALAQERASRLLATAEAVALTSGLPEALAARDRAELARLSAPWLERIGTATIAYTDERGVMVLRTYAPERYGDDMAATTKGLLPALRGDPSVSTEATGLRGLAIRAFAPVRLSGRVVGIAATTQNLDQEFLTALREAAGFETFALFLDGSAVGTAPDPATLAALVSGRAEHTGLGLVGGQEQAVHAWPLRDPTGTIVGYLGVVFPLEGLAAAQTEGRRSAMLAGLVAVCAAGLLAWLLSSLLVVPIERIGRSARAIAAGASARIPDLRTGDELEELSAALGAMVSNLSAQSRDLVGLNARLRDEGTRSQALAEVSRAFAEARLDLPQVLAATARRVAELLDGGCVVRELSADGRLLTPVAFHHTEPEALAFWRELLATPQPVAEGLNGRAVRTGETQFYPRLAPEEARAMMAPSHLPYYDRFRIRSALVVPLRARGRPIGTLSVQRSASDRPFTEDERAFVEELADRAGLAIDQARLYQEVSESEERYRAVVEQSVDAIVVVEGTIAVYANQAYLRLLGVHSPDEVLGRSGDAWVHPDDVARVNARALARQRGEAVPPMYDFRVVRSDGDVRAVEVVPTVITRNGRPATLAVLRDITERTQAEAARRLLSEASAVLGSSLDYATTLAAVTRLIVAELADWCTVYLREGSVVRRVAAAHVDPEHDALLQALAMLPPRPSEWPDPVRRVVETGKPLLVPVVTSEGITQYAAGDEHLRLLRQLAPRSSIVVPLVARGEPIGALGMNRGDGRPPFRSDDLALAQQLADRCAIAIDNARLYADAQAAIAARDQFLSIAAHELRTPMTAVKGYTQTLLRALGRGALDEERLRRSLESVLGSVNRLAALTDDLLDVGRLRTGRLELQREAVDMAVLVRELAVRMGETLDADHRLTVATEGSCVALVDPTRLEQVLTNLIENAVKYSPAGGEVRLTARAEGGGVRIEVADNGIGLPPTAAERIFDPFGRAANATARNLPGMGLGLFISRGIVEQHGGWIRAESPGEDRGTTVSLWLPSGALEPVAAGAIDIDKEEHG